jgi:hypothetical protein
VSSRTTLRIVGLVLLTAGAGIGTGIAASAGAGPLAELPGHAPAAVHAAARATAAPSPFRADLLFPGATPAPPLDQTVYVQDPTLPPLVITPAPTPVSVPAAVAPAPAAPAITDPPQPAPPVATAAPAPTPGPTPRPTRAPRPCGFLFCGGGG